MDLAGLGLFGLEDKTPFWRIYRLSTYHKQETRGLDTIQATSFLGGYFSSFQINFQAKGGLSKVLKSGNFLINHRLVRSDLEKCLTVYHHKRVPSPDSMVP